jgi:hypothetical protein
MKKKQNSIPKEGEDIEIKKKSTVIRKNQLFVTRFRFIIVPELMKLISEAVKGVNKAMRFRLWR